MKNLLLLGTALATFAAAPALAQSTGSREVEATTSEIIVTATRTQDVGGVIAPDAPKAKAVITDELIGKQRAGQTILDTINLIPGVSFQNNDPYGSAGGP